MINYQLKLDKPMKDIFSLEIKNKCFFSIKLYFDNTYFIISSENKINLNIYQNCIIKIEPINVFDEGNSAVDKLIGSVATSSVLITCSEILLKAASKNSSLIINSDISQVDDVFGYLYLTYETYNCNVETKKCIGINKKQVLKYQKLYALGDTMDFPPFSIVRSITKYIKIKKICNSQNISLTGNCSKPQKK